MYSDSNAATSGSALGSRATEWLLRFRSMEIVSPMGPLSPSPAWKTTVVRGWRAGYGSCRTERLINTLGHDYLLYASVLIPQIDDFYVVYRRIKGPILVRGAVIFASS